MSPSLVDAIIRTESASPQHPEGFDGAIGDTNLLNKAYGPMQIRQPVCDDVNRSYKLDLKAEQMLNNRDLSIVVFCLYMGIYATSTHLGHFASDEDRARIWNGGPYGYENPETLGYWAKVKPLLS